MSFCRYIRPRCGHASSALLMAVLLSGCGTLETTKSDYRSVQRSRPLDLPPELSAPAKDDRYTVSDVSSKGTSFSSYAAERGSAAAKPDTPAAKASPLLLLPSEKMRLERAGSQRWLVVQARPEEVWALLKNFIQSRNLVIKFEAPELGLLETDWAERQVYVPEDGIRGKLAKAFGTTYSTSERDKFRFRIEAGRDPGTTEIYVSQRGIEEVYVSEMKDNTRWQPRANDPEREFDLLGRLIQFAGVDEKTVAGKIAGATAGDRARLVDSNGRQSVEVDERFDRAWRRVGLALDRNGFAVEDRDRTNGFYFVRYIDSLADRQAAQKSWLDLLAFWRDDVSAGESVPVVYRIKVAAAGEEMTRVEVQDKAGVVLNNTTSQKILEIVRSELK